jgi:membrane-associated phospholipid phosphatase
LIYVNIKQISNLQLHSRRDRIFPLAVTAGFYTINYLIVSRMHDIVPVIIDRFYLTAAVGVFLTLLINFKTKISAHTLAFGGFIGYSCNFDRLMNIAGLLPILIFIGLASIIATSRLKLQAHTPFEVYLGILVGLAVGFSSGFLF